ncbi:MULTISPECIES: mucin-2 [unclassified Streptomyces]|uniref:mucin-2 n=1 Tax=Streptomyces sp. NPDC055082 TaxID=3365718 RepID=UPI0037D22FFB
MSWFRIDDTAYGHPKVLKAKNPAYGLWSRCGSYAAQQLTDGMIPGVVAELYGTAPQVRKLIAAGLWHEHGHTCPHPKCAQPAPGDYYMHDYLDYNPSRTSVEQGRDRAADRQKRAREKAAGQRNQTRNYPDSVVNGDSFAGERSAENHESGSENIAFPDLFAGQEGSSQRDGVDPSRSPRPDPSRSTSFGGTPPNPQGGKGAAAALVEEWWSSYGRGTAQSRKTVARAVEDALGNGLDASLLAAAMDRLGQTSKPVTGGTLQFALSEIRRPAAGAAVIPLNPHAPRTLGRAANAAAVMAELLGQENAQ